jgi:hypothetical protein
MMSARDVVARWLPRHRDRGVAPDVETFLQWLAATPYSWDVQADGRIRADDHGTALCAVTAVARHRQALAFSVGDWVRAGASLGLSYATAGLIVDAADGRATSGGSKMLRARLLGAARIGAKPAPPATERTRSLGSARVIPALCVPSLRTGRQMYPRRRSGRDPRTPSPSASRR